MSPDISDLELIEELQDRLDKATMRFEAPRRPDYQAGWNDAFSVVASWLIMWRDEHHDQS